MHLLLTDILACPRCGPDAGLILLSHDTRDRRVLEGWLGCARCDARWVVRDGFGEFRAPLGEEAAADDGPALPAADPEEAVRIAALLGIGPGGGRVLVTGPAARHASALVPLVEGLDVVAAHPALAQADERPGIDRIAIGAKLPFYDGRLHGVWLAGPSAGALLEEGARVVRPLGRLVLEPAPEDAEPRLAAAGFSILARKDATLVAARAG